MEDYREREKIELEMAFGERPPDERYLRDIAKQRAERLERERNMSPVERAYHEACRANPPTPEQLERGSNICEMG